MKNELNFRERLVRHQGNAMSCVVLMLLNLFFAPLAAVGDVSCHHAPDLNCDEVVDGQDLSLVLGAWGGSERAMDLDGSCTVDGGDLALILGNWGAIPEPPGLSSLEYQQEAARFCSSVDSIEATIGPGQLPGDQLDVEPGGEKKVMF